MKIRNKNFELKPAEIVRELDLYVEGQTKAKIAVAVALRNRWRRKNILDPFMQEEIMPKNILMIGPTGVGKTEIARRLAKLSGAPFIKVEATKFTEVGYVGRDVDSIIRDLVEAAISMVRERFKIEVAEVAKSKVEEKILNILVGEETSEETKEKFLNLLRSGAIDDKEIEIKVTDNKQNVMSSFDFPGGTGQVGMINISDMLGKVIGEKKTKMKKLAIADAYKILINEESDKLIDEELIIHQAVFETENNGIVFIDEIDKIATGQGEGGRNRDISREGVQRDLLPLIEGSCISTKYGAIKTDHILFIASGAFYNAKPADLLPELQGRLPIRVELNALDKNDMVNILTKPKASLIKQYVALLDTENIELNFTEDGIDKIAELAAEVNENVENIGARRLHTMMEKLLELLSFNAEQYHGEVITIDKKYVDEKLGEIVRKVDLSKFIL